MASSLVHDPRILDTLSAINPVALETQVHRVRRREQGARS